MVVACIRDIQTKARIVDCVLGCHRDPYLPDVAWGNIAVAKSPDHQLFGSGAV